MGSALPEDDSYGAEYRRDTSSSHVALLRNDSYWLTRPAPVWQVELGILLVIASLTVIAAILVVARSWFRASLALLALLLLAAWYVRAKWLARR